MRSFLGVMGYELEKDTITEYATRLTTKSEHKVDLMVTDYLYGKAKERTLHLPENDSAVCPEVVRPYGAAAIF